MEKQLSALICIFSTFLGACSLYRELSSEIQVTQPTKSETNFVSTNSRANSLVNSRTNSVLISSRIEVLTIKEDIKEEEAEDDEGRTIFPCERLKISSPDPVPDIDVTKREIYLSKEDFREKFGMTKEASYKMPKWKQNKHKMALDLF